jgi:O-antigen ligase
VLRLILVIGCCALLVLSFSRERILLLCYYYFAFGVLTIVNEDTVPLLGGLKLYRIAYPFLLLSVLVSFVRDPMSYERFRRWPNLSYLALVFSLIISSFYSPYTNVLVFSDPQGIVSILVVCSLFWIAASHMQEHEDFIKFALTTVALSVSLSLWVIWIAAQGDFTAFRGGTNINENYESLFVLCGAIPLIQFVLISKGILQRMASSAALLVILFASSILASRGMLLAAAAGAIVTTIGLLSKLPRRRLLTTGALFALVIGCVILLPGASNIADAFQSVDLGTLDDRTVIWHYAWRHFASSGGFETFFGGGLSSGITVLSSVFPEMPNYHNDYLMWLMEHGLIGLSLFLLFLCRIAYILVRTCDPYKYLMLGWYVFLLVVGLSATSSNEHLYWIMLGVMVGAASGCQMIGVRQQEFVRSRDLSPPVTHLA